MDSRNRSPRRNPTIILKFKNPSMAAREQLAEDDDEEEAGEGYLQFGSDGGIKKKKMADSGGSGGGGGGSGKRETAAINGGRIMTPCCCQVDSCAADLTVAKRYHRRHKVCEVHSKSPVVVVAGILQRFCQQCSRFHDVAEFDEARRSCRSRLAGHNERRRKLSSEHSKLESWAGR